MDLSSFIKAHGKVKELPLLPSGDSCIIREQNGDDDAILSTVSMAKNLEGLNMFISQIVVYLESIKGPPTVQDILNMKLNDKYTILIASRIFSLGPVLRFAYSWDSTLPEVMYEEDLERYLWDYSMPFPERGHPDYFDQRIPPYGLTGPTVEFILDSGKELRFKYLTSLGEKYLLSLPDLSKNINSQILAREMEMKINGEYTKVASFKNFTSREMSQIRNMIEKLDPQFDGLTYISNPNENGPEMPISIIGVMDFFFPREI